MADELNPYATPRFVEGESTAAPATNGLNALKGPSLALLVFSLWSIAGGLMMLLVSAIFAINFLYGRTVGLGPTSNTPDVHDQLIYASFIVSAVSSVFVFRGALAMRSGQGYRRALIAALLSCVPFVTPMIYVGVPFGIWALVVLCLPRVRAAFES